MLRCKDCLGHTQRKKEMLRNATVRRVNRQDHQEEGPGGTGLQHRRRQRPRQDDKKQLVMIQCQASSDDHLRQPTVETDVIEQNTEMDAETAKVRTEQIKEC